MFNVGRGFALVINFYTLLIRFEWPFYTRHDRDISRFPVSLSANENANTRIMINYDQIKLYIYGFNARSNSSLCTNHKQGWEFEARIEADFFGLCETAH